MKTLRSGMTLSLLLALASNGQAQQDDVRILLRRVPESADALLIVRLRTLLDSPRGQQENWAAKYQLGFLHGAVRIPPSVRSLVIASEIHPTSTSTTFGVALLNSRKRISMPALAAKEGGQLTTVADQQVVLTSRNSLIAELAPGFIGAMTPPDRKEFARWMRFAMTDREPTLSPYLSNAVSAGRGAPIQLAIQLKDLLDPKAVQQWLVKKEKEGKKINVEPLMELVQGMVGIRFVARVQDRITADVSLDFSKSVADRANTIRDLFVESLDEVGAAIDELRDAQVRTESDGRTVVLRADLSDTALAEIMSLIQMPTFHADPDDSKTPPAPGKVSLAATTQYFNAVQQILDDLRRKLRRADDYKKTALWHETFAKKITELPQEGVDEEMVRYGSLVASQLWALANSLRGVPLKVEILDGQKYYYSYQPPSIWIGRRRPFFPGPSPFLFFGGSGYVDTNIPEITAKQQEAVQQSEYVRDQIWKTIDQDRLKIRRRMSDKFKTDFGQATN
jgi:hypothetical protein